MKHGPSEPGEGLSSGAQDEPGKKRDVGFTHQSPGDGSDQPLTLSGGLRIVPTPSLGTSLRWITGIAGVLWLLHALLWFAGLRRRATVTVVRGGVQVDERWEVLGQLVRSRRVVYALASIFSIARKEHRWLWPFYLGSFASAFGIVFGMNCLFDGVWTGEAFLIIVAAVFVIVGVGFDFGMYLLLPRLRNQVSVELWLRPRGRLTIGSIGGAEADVFLDGLWERIAEYASLNTETYRSSAPRQHPIPFESRSISERTS
ncbi:MAG: hypothetical protein AAF550_05880 [Myxococcota bacterium]